MFLLYIHLTKMGANSTALLQKTVDTRRILANGKNHDFERMFYLYLIKKRFCLIDI